MGGHVVGADWLVSFEKDVGRLTGSNDNQISVVWIGVGGIDGDNCHAMIGNLEEELIIECSIDDPQQVSLASLYLELVCI